MITRLQVDGFKNLEGFDVYFGPFTCIAGPNGVGKSNVFDVLQFLGYLTEHPVMKAAEMVRGGGGSYLSGSSAFDIFGRRGKDLVDRISIGVEMIINPKGIDELGQEASATSNFLRYDLELVLAKTDDARQKITISKEVLTYINKGAAGKHLPFPHDAKWRGKLIYNDRKSGTFISTEEKDGQILINLHQDGGSKGRPNPFSAATMPRTLLSSARYASESPTVLLAKREMQKWKFLQLEPSGLRKPSELDKVGYDTRVSWDGSNLPGTVYRLANDSSTHDYFPDEAALYASLANQLAQLLPDVRSVRVDKDEQRRLLTLEIIDRFGITLPARSLSDGTLRFLALSILSADYTEDSLLFLEEPENGIHPDRVGTIIELLQDMCFDPFDADYDGEPIRQVIVNTHSPGVVAVMPVDSLLFVNQKTSKKGEHTISTASVSVIADTWRAKGARKNKEVSLGQLLYYLDPAMSTNSANKSESVKRTTQKVGDKFRNQLTLAFSGDE